MNGVYQCALLDAGAQISLLNRTVLENSSHHKTLQEDKNVKGLSIKTFGNRITARDRALVTVMIGDEDKVKLEVTCIVVEEEDMACCILLGNNVIKDLHIVLDFSQDISKFLIDSDLEFSLPFLTAGISGRDHGYCLSHEEMESDLKSFLSVNQIRMLQSRQAELRQLRSKLDSGVPVSSWKILNLNKFRRFASNLSVKNDLIVFLNDSRDVPVVSFVFMVEMSIRLHWQLCHAGRNKLLEHLRDLIWHPSLSYILGVSYIQG